MLTNLNILKEITKALLTGSNDKKLIIGKVIENLDPKGTDKELPSRIVSVLNSIINDGKITLINIKN